MILEVGKNGSALISSYDRNRAAIEKGEAKIGFALEGGSRSGKSYETVLFLDYYCLLNKNQGKEIFVARRTLQDLKKTLYKTFKKALRQVGHYHPKHERLTDPKSYSLHGNTITFGGMDDLGAHGNENDVIWVNEAMEVPEGAFKQLNQRCNEIFILDYNPYAKEHWIYDSICNRPDVTHVKTTLLDNPFVPFGQKQEILAYEPTPENVANGTASPFLWKVYGKGERGIDARGLVFHNHKEFTELPTDIRLFEYVGLDWGYSQDPLACARIWISDNPRRIYIQELIYETGLAPSMVEPRLHEAGVRKLEDKIIADDSRGDVIDDLYYVHGYDIERCTKGAGSIELGIDEMRSYELYIHRDSHNAQKERENYKYKFNRTTGMVTNKPEDGFNHIFDGVRYVLRFHQNEARYR